VLAPTRELALQIEAEINQIVGVSEFSWFFSVSFFIYSYCPVLL
jgi:superfamily II DNA/RNA helicase